MPRNRGGFRLPLCRVLLTGLIVGAGAGGLSVMLTGALADRGQSVDSVGAYILSGLVGVLPGAAIGLASSVLALIATAIYRAFGGRSRRKLIVVAASAASISAIAALLMLSVIPGLEISLWWILVHGVAVFGITTFQSHLLATAARPRSRAAGRPRVRPAAASS